MKLHTLLKRCSLTSRDLIWSSNRNWENATNFCAKNWYVKFTVVLMIPVPWVRIEFATCLILIVLMCLRYAALDNLSMNTYTWSHKITQLRNLMWEHLGSNFQNHGLSTQNLNTKQIKCIEEKVKSPVCWGCRCKRLQKCGCCALCLIHQHLVQVSGMVDGCHPVPNHTFVLPVAAFLHMSALASNAYEFMYRTHSTIDSQKHALQFKP